MSAPLATTTEIDPVCGMHVDQSGAASSAHAGKTHYLCCTGCKARFDKNPTEFAESKGPKTSDGCGCG
ncbi:MAG: YHS domain-containing protein [Acidobacteriota bacterium]